MTVGVTSTDEHRAAPPPLRPQTSKGWFWLGAKIILSVTIFAAAISQIDGPALLEQLRTFSPFTGGLALLALAISIVAAAIRWSYLSKPYATVGAREATAITFAAQFVGQVLPSSLGQDAVRVWLAIRDHRKAADTVSIVLLDRMCGLVGLSALIFAGVPRLAELGGVTQGQQAVAMAGGLAVAAAAGALVIRLVPAPKGLPIVLQKIWEAARRAAQMLTSAKGLAAIAISVGVQALVTLCVWLIAQSIGASLTLLDGLATIPVAMFVALLPISMNGWGVREGAMVISLGFAGVAASHAFLISILFGIALLVTSLPGALALISLRRVK